MNSRMYVAALFTCMVSCLGTKGEINSLSKNQMACKNFSKLSYFDPELVIGPEWRIYYTWNVKLKQNCLGLRFSNVNPWVVHRFWRDMGKYLEKQPLWTAALLYATMGASKHQVLILSDYGPAGRVHGVPNLIREPDFPKIPMSVPLLQLQMKLIRGGKYLIIMDCVGGEISLSTRFNPKQPPYRAEIEIMAEQLGFGRGTMACKNTRD